MRVGCIWWNLLRPRGRVCLENQQTARRQPPNSASRFAVRFEVRGVFKYSVWPIVRDSCRTDSQHQACAAGCGSSFQHVRRCSGLWGRADRHLPAPFAGRESTGDPFVPIVVYRQVSKPLQSVLGYRIGAEDNGVPAEDDIESLSCVISEEKFPSLKNVEYYENDSAYELELTGFVCVTCGAGVSEESRARRSWAEQKAKESPRQNAQNVQTRWGDKKAWENR